MEAGGSRRRGFQRGRRPRGSGATGFAACGRRGGGGGLQLALNSCRDTPSPLTLNLKEILQPTASTTPSVHLAAASTAPSSSPQPHRPPHCCIHRLQPHPPRHPSTSPPHPPPHPRRHSPIRPPPRRRPIRPPPRRRPIHRRCRSALRCLAEIKMPPGRMVGETTRTDLGGGK
jgi:hypothetical protein